MGPGTTDCHFSLWGQSICPSQVMLGPTAEKKQLTDIFGVDEIAQWIELPATYLGIHAPQIEKYIRKHIEKRNFQLRGEKILAIKKRSLR